MFPISCLMKELDIVIKGVPIKAANRRPEKSRKLKFLFSVHDPV